MVAKEVKYNQEQCSVVTIVRATSAVAIWEHGGRKLKHGTCMRKDGSVVFQFDHEIERNVKRLRREQRNSKTVSAGQFNGLPNEDPHLHFKLFLESQWQKHISQDPITSLEALIKEYIAKNEPIWQSQAIFLRNLENQMGQLAKAMSSRTQESLPSNTEDLRREGKEHCKVINLRSGKNVDIPVDVTKKGMEFNSSQKPPPDGSMLQQSDHQDTSYRGQATATSEGTQPVHAEKEVATPVATTYNKPNKQSLVPTEATQQFRHPPPFPQRFQKQKQDKQFNKFLEVLKQLHINIPFVEALEQMPNYVKFLKDILARKRRLGEFETVALTQESSHMLQSKIHTKVKDPGSFTIPCVVQILLNSQAHESIVV
ncbi:hypothetical protein KPL70_007635 [Citrus sinensis]|nr:hypothetical protein KPL70_007635 [Citrus sinensis]